MTDVFSHSTIMICLRTLLVCHITKQKRNMFNVAEFNIY